ncbi:glutamate ABC transporter substrate-binding protein [Corynebacterium otitidis]|uniref:glutamate ABC transporter substrate-binding protein n=1 Tax=Corynebacterium otitidis TaxID=29321 RepID=UPI000627B371|nr:glutamate ABC transporter substrate-binding protein [Corynebacterium otitidis]KKO83793.1 ABC transporter [Corynebacterium otitidis]
MTRQRTTARAAAAVCAAALALSACGIVDDQSEPPPAEAPPGAEEPRAAGFGPPLPLGAEVEPAGAYPPQDTPPAHISASLRPGPGGPEDRVPEILERGRLVVGVDQSLNLISYRDAASGELDGFEVDLAREIARDIFGDPEAVEFRFVESAGGLDTLANSDVDAVIRTMTMTPARAEQVAFSAPYLEAATRLLALNGSGINSVDDLADRTVCVVDNTTGLQTARKHAPRSPILKTRNWSDCLVALQQDQADAILSDDTLLSGIAAQDSLTEIVGPPLDRGFYAVALPPGRDGLVRQVNATIERIGEDGTWRGMHEAWFGSSLPTPPGPPEPRYREEDSDE